MPRVCTICTHEQRPEIDAALLNETPLRNIAECFGTSTTALHRHKEGHISRHLAKAQEAHEVAQADDLLKQVSSLKARALSILDQAEGAGDLRTAVSAIREARATVELFAKLSGELNEGVTVNLTVNAEWLSIRAVILQAVTPYPDAAKAITAALSTPERA